ncbi:F0F1 ATP synthase subunit delta [Propionibacterium cyclohexanicum]|nr:F0F1 ATP synthase subunit delta [Propionibacterium cyclohexanicum]
MNHLRGNRLDALGDRAPARLSDALGLFAFADILRQFGALRRALCDPTLPAGQRGQLIATLVGSRLDASVLHFLQEAVALDWPSGLELASGLDRQAARIALRSADPGVVRTELNAVREAVASDEALRSAFGRPGDPGDSRGQLVRALIGGRAGEVSVALATRAARGGSAMLHELDGYLELSSQVQGHRLARATVARRLPADQAQRLAEQLSRIFGAPVDVVEHVDPQVLGGVRVQVGDDVIDGTVRTAVDQAARALA